MEQNLKKVQGLSFETKEAVENFTYAHTFPIPCLV